MSRIGDTMGKGEGGNDDPKAGHGKRGFGKSVSLPDELDLGAIQVGCSTPKGLRPKAQGWRLAYPGDGRF